MTIYLLARKDVLGGGAWLTGLVICACLIVRRL